MPLCASCLIVELLVSCSFKDLAWVPGPLPSYIQHLYLDSNRISELNSSSLWGLSQLERLDLGAQKVPLIIRNNAFLSQRYLKTLILSSNRGLRLEPRAFAGLHSLQTLFIDYCDLTDSILTDNYLQPLYSLEKLELSYNRIVRVQPGSFFSRLNKFKELELKLNQIDSLCEEDLTGFQGITFSRLNLHSNKLNHMSSPDFNWEQCGNPFRNMSFNTLDISSNGFNMNTFRLFLKAIAGTPITVLRYSGSLGKGFSFNNLPDPDQHTFEGLRNSSVNVLDLDKNYIFALQEAIFRHLINATHISVSNNKINQIQKNAFSGLHSLHMLNLSSNLLGEIYSHTFDHLTDLRELDLSYNHIGVLGYEAFSRLPLLKLLNLKGNSLRSLGSTALLPNLETLVLSDNRLSSLWWLNKFVGRNITYLEVQDNRLTFLDDVYTIVTLFRHLQKLFFGGNFIKWCRSPAAGNRNNSLTILDLHDSSLQVLWAQGSCLDIFDDLSNLRGLDLRGNLLTALPQGIFQGLSSIIEIDLSSNSLTYLQPDTFPISLLLLDLSNNFLASLNPNAFRALAFIDLARNSFYCDCNLENFLWWLNRTNVTFLSPVKELTCEFPSNLQNLPLLSYSNIIESCEEDDEKAVLELRFALVIFSTLLVLTVVLGGFVYARLRGHIFIIYKKVIGRVLDGPKPPPHLENLQYDAYLCFSNADYKWVEMALLKKLDSQFSEKNLLRCCFEARDFLPGEDHLTNIRDAIWGSRKTICVVSSKFLKDGWCVEAFTLAQGRKLEELTNVLIMLVVGKVAHYQLMRYNAIRAFVQTREYLVWPEDPQDLDWFYERLVSQILKNNKAKKKKAAEDESQPAENNSIPLENLRPV